MKEKIRLIFTNKEYVCMLIFAIVSVLYLVDVFELHKLDTTKANFYQLIFILITSVFVVFFIRFKDIDTDILKYYGNIPVLYTRCFYIVFGMLCMTFSFHMFYMMWGNHDWWMLIRGLRLGDYVSQGRYGQTLMKNILLGGYYVPVLTHLISFAFLSLANVCLCIYWNVPKKLICYILVGLLLFLQPFILPWFYFVKDIPDNLCIPFIVVFALMILDRGWNYYIEHKKICYLCFLSTVVLLVYALSIFPVAVNTIATIFLGKIFLQTLERNSDINWKEFIKRYFWEGVNIVLAGVVYKISLVCLEKYHLFNPNAYNTKSLPLCKMWERILESVSIAFKQLSWYEFSFMPNYITEIFTLFLILLVISILANVYDKRLGKVCKSGFSICMLFFVFMASKISCVLGNYAGFNQPRIDFFSIPFFRVLVVIALLTTFRSAVVRCFVVLLSCSIIWVSVVSDLNAQRVWKLGFESAVLEYNRILTRLELIPEFSKNKGYFLVCVGREPSEREFYHVRSRKEMSSVDLLTHRYNLSPWDAEQFYMRLRFIKNRFDTTNWKRVIDNKEFKDIVSRLWQSGKLEGILNESKSKDVILIHEDIILHVNSANALNTFVKQCKTILK